MSPSLRALYDDEFNDSANGDDDDHDGNGDGDGDDFEDEADEDDDDVGVCARAAQMLLLRSNGLPAPLRLLSLTFL